MQNKRPGPVAQAVSFFFLWTLFCSIVLSAVRQPGVSGSHPFFVVLYFGGFVVFGLYFSNDTVRRYINGALRALSLRID